MNGNAVLGYTNNNNYKIKVTLGKVLYVPNLSCNLLSVSTFTERDYEVVENKKGYTLRKIDGSGQIDLMKKYNVGNGFLYGGNYEVLNPIPDADFLTVKQFHEKLGHPGMQANIRTAKQNNIQLEVPLTMTQPCEDCSHAKSRRLNLAPIRKNPELIVGERIAFDLSWIDVKSLGGKEYWLHAIDEYRKCTWSYLLQEKSELSENMIHLIQHIINNGVTITHLRCDGAGENYAFQKASEEQQLGIHFEFTPISTPQHNGTVERSFQTLYNRIRAMLNGGGLKGILPKKIWEELSRTATLLNNEVVKYNQDKSPYVQF